MNVPLKTTMAKATAKTDKNAIRRREGTTRGIERTKTAIRKRMNHSLSLPGLNGDAMLFRLVWAYRIVTSVSHSVNAPSTAVLQAFGRSGVAVSERECNLESSTIDEPLPECGRRRVKSKEVSAIEDVPAAEFQ